MNIYRLYAQNGDRAGFWVQHRTWGNLCAQVQSIGGLQSGSLPGAAPLHDNAIVRVRGFDVRSGRPMPLGPDLDDPDDRNYNTIAEPSWNHER